MKKIDIWHAYTFAMTFIILMKQHNPATDLKALGIILAIAALLCTIIFKEEQENAFHYRFI